MSDRLPAALLARRRRARWVVAIVLCLGAAAFVDDVSNGVGYGSAEPGEHVVTGRVTGEFGDPEVLYRHPVTDQDVTAPLWLWSSPEPEPGDTVQLVVGADPMGVELLGDHFGPETNAYVYFCAALIAAAAWASTWWSLRRAERLVGRPSTTYSMIGVVTAGRGWRRRSADLHLYALDARPGSLPVCSVPLATMADIGVGRPFPVEVKGDPRPLGRVAAATTAAVLWPRRRALRRADRPLPDGPTFEPSTPRAVAAPARGLERSGVLERMRVPVLVAAAALVGVMSVTVMTARGAAQARRFDARADVAVAEVVGYREDTTVVELQVVGTDRRVQIGSPLADDHPIGVRYEVLVDPDPEVEGARFVAFPYNPVEPIVWVLVPFATALAWCGLRGSELRRLARVARRGPWREYPAQVLAGASTATAVLLDERDAPVASVLLGVQVPHHDAAVLTAGPRNVIVGGELGPAAPVAVWPSSLDSALPSRPVVLPDVSAALFAPVPPAGDLEGVEEQGTTEATEDVVIALAGTWLQRVPPDLRVVGDRVELRLPSWFGRRTWSIPIDTIAVHDLTLEPPHTAEDDLVFAERVRVPYLATANARSDATVGLYFDQPQPIPPLRWPQFASGLAWRGRSKEPVALDGVLLRAEQPGLMCDVLTRAGAERVHDPQLWWAQHRELLHDAGERAAVLRSARLERLLSGAGWFAAAVAISMSWLSGDAPGTADVTVIAVSAAAAALLFGAAAWIRRSL